MKREREKHITRLHIILFFLVIIIGVSIYIGVNIGKNKNIDNYKEFEKELVNASELYYKLNNIELEDGFEKKVNIKKLDEQGLIQNELITKCKGYVIMSSERDIYSEEYIIEHIAYIKCGKRYTSVNYSEY